MFFFKLIIVVISSLLISQAGRACSYLLPSKLESLQNVEVAIEGPVTALYIDGEQISTEQFIETIRRFRHPVTIRVVVDATTTYLGDAEGRTEFELEYDPFNSCKDLTPLHSFNKLWSLARAQDGKLYTSLFIDGEADRLLPLLKAANLYLSGLKDALTGLEQEDQIRELIVGEIYQTKRLLKGEKPSEYIPVGIYKLPNHLLELRTDIYLEAELPAIATMTNSMIR